MPQQSIVFLAGERLDLRPFEADDLPNVVRWANDPKLRGLTAQVRPMTNASAREWFERLSSDESRIWFTIVLKDGDRPIGEAGFLRMDHPWRTTDLTLIIGESDCWGKGYGREAILLLLEYGFGYLNFHRVAVGVVGYNERALRFYRSIGFKQEGIQRDGYFYKHAYHDFVMMSILEDEYRKLHCSQ